MLSCGVGGDRCRPRSSKLPHSSAWRRRHQKTENTDRTTAKEPVVRRSQPKRHRQIAEKEHRGEEFGRRRAEDPRESHSAEQGGRRAQPTAGEKSTPNSRRQSKEQKEQCQLQAETYEENNVSKQEVGPMTRNKDTESHQRMAAD